jgi:hypothetical protein
MHDFCGTTQKQQTASQQATDGRQPTDQQNPTQLGIEKSFLSVE